MPGYTFFRDAGGDNVSDTIYTITDKPPWQRGKAYHPSCYCAGSIPSELGGLGALENLHLRNNKMGGKSVEGHIICQERHYFFDNNMARLFGLR